MLLHARVSVVPRATLNAVIAVHLAKLPGQSVAGNREIPLRTRRHGILMKIPSQYLNNPAWVAHQKARLLCRAMTNTRGCKVWQGPKKHDGYPKTHVVNQTCFTHRLMFLLAKGPLISGMQIDHICGNPSCINPEHLEQVTPRENRRRSSTGHWVGTETHCAKGHLYTGSNILRDGTTIRCRTCRNKKQREWMRKHKKPTCRAYVRKAPYKNHIQNPVSLAS